MPQARRTLSGGRLGCLRPEVLVIDADGQRRHPHLPARQADARGIVEDRHVEVLAHAGEEVPDVGVGLEGQQVRPEQPAQQLLTPAENAEDRRGRKRDVPEDAEPGGDAGGAQQPGHEAEMEVVDPHEVAGHHTGLHRCREALVGRPVGGPVVLLDAAAARKHVAQRPEHLIREPGVVVADLALLQPDGADRVGEPRGLGAEVVGRMLPDPCDPGAVVGSQRVVEGRRETAHRALRMHALRAAHHLEGRAIGHDDQTRGAHARISLCARPAMRSINSRPIWWPAADTRRGRRDAGRAG